MLEYDNKNLPVIKKPIKVNMVLIGNLPKL